MKKYRLKRWVIDALVIISFMITIFASIDFESMLLQFIVSTISFGIICFNIYLLNKYGDLENRNDI